MNCKEFETAFELAVEQRSSLDRVVADHLAECASCKESWQNQRTLDAAIVVWKASQPSTDLVDRVLQELAESPDFVDLECLTPIDDELAGADIQWSIPQTQPAAPSTRSHRIKSRGRWMLASIAACLVAIVFVSDQISRTPPVQKLDNVAGSGEAAFIDISATNLPRDYSNSVTEVMTELHSEYDEFASETTAVVVAIADAISPHANAPEPASKDSEGQDDLVPEASDAVRMWQPIGDQVKSAFGFLLLALPGQSPSS